jgi:hypothetical protein
LSVPILGPIYGFSFWCYYFDLVVNKIPCILLFTIIPLCVSLLGFKHGLRYSKTCTFSDFMR